MNESPSALLSVAYQTALRSHLAPGSQAALQAARDLGRTAVALGLETLELAGIHDHALAALLAAEPTPAGRTELARQAAGFFAEVILPVEKTHPAAQAASANLDEMHAALDQRTEDLAASNRELQRQIDGRKTAEAALRISQNSASQLLHDSRLLEQHLHNMTRRILSASEEERRAMSLLLNGDIAQNLLGINIRMIALKSEISANQANHPDEIAVIQRLVEDSAAMIKRLADEFRIPHA